ncbi:hypothetical protein CEUSTIGMA_g9774.t1 [Chlamydomonas eustigma]|uniref:Ubiquitin-like domain-containing protein n=1 Tax=Chlamydomonas eustigma TaxID=1157962 RepID=A0A250XGY6_9CHLO|nr:hypothetical protein CEUSTIGMA_g9774.t1 [Chlamydomonas eustigma]|eukprot:GAX82345.1 hypothetical protein CEUSTIGMA_g9774.t1 [Chlamydomonas eustigma]
MKITVSSRSGKTVAILDVDAHETVRNLKKKLHARKQVLHPERQRLTLLPKEGESRGEVLDDSKTVADYGLKDGDAILCKDLGPQIGYSTVFFWEYFGPLIVYPLFYYLPKYLYPGQEIPSQHAKAQDIALAYWSFHYAKRIMETYLVHKFGHATMPIFNLFKNCTYYWGFTAFVSYFINHPLYTPPPLIQTYVAFGFAAVCQISNFWCHILLAKLRTPGDKSYKIPRGFLFNYVTCANYTAEAWGWIAFTVGVQALPAALFTLAGGYQMAVWAMQKHKRLKKIFDGKEGRANYPKRWIIFPPFF